MRRKDMRRMLLSGIVVAVTIGSLTTALRSAQTGGSSAPVTKADYERWKTELSNWGRWGRDDQIGALNLVTPAKRRQAAALVKEGFTVSLAGGVNTLKAEENFAPL